MSDGEQVTPTTLADSITNAVLGTLPVDVEPRTLWVAVSLAMNLVLRRIPFEQQSELDRVAFVKAVLQDGPVSDVWRALAGKPLDTPAENKRTCYCSFCGKSQHEVRKLIAGPTVFICDECIELCVEIATTPNQPER